MSKDHNSSNSNTLQETNKEERNSAASAQKESDNLTAEQVTDLAQLKENDCSFGQTSQVPESVQANDSSTENNNRSEEPLQPSADSQQHNQPQNTTTSATTTTDNNPQIKSKRKRRRKNNRLTAEQQTQNDSRHIMISYNHSTLATCQKICDDLRKRNYNVWMDQDNMRHNVLLAMGLAVENSYVVLLCINRKYCKSRYCKLEAEYAVEKQVKCIPCFMVKPFDLQGSSLGIIKGANLHIDFSATDKYDESLKKLIDEITHTETQLNISPRYNPAASIPSISSPIIAPTTTSTTSYMDLRCRFDAVVRNYKTSIRKKHHPLERLSRLELILLINRLRKNLFTDISQTSSATDTSDDDDDDDDDNDDQTEETEDNDDQQKTCEENNSQRQENTDHLWQHLLILSRNRTDELISVVCHMTLFPTLFTIIKILFIIMILRILYLQFNSI